jgi:penicillin-binding protein 1B
VSIFSGLHYGLQVCAEEETSQFLNQLQSQARSGRKDTLQAAVLALDVRNGLVQAWVGGRDYGESQFDRVLHAKRQIGSTVKPFLYLSALDPKLNSYRTATAISVLPDAPLKLRLPNGDIWQPENYDHQFRGDVTLRYAMEKSLNVPAVYVGQKVGFSTVAHVLERVRIAKNIAALPSVALGAIDANLLRLTAAYAALASGGIYTEPRLFSSVQNSEFERILSSKIEQERIAQTGPVYLLNNLLQGVVERGTGSVIRQQGFTGMAAGKTGTSNDARDAWFIGYSPHLALGIWVGFDDNSVLGLSGAKAAAPLWGKIMKCAEGYYPDSHFPPPDDIRQIRIDATSGLLYDPRCSNANPVEELFVVGTEPTRSCRGELVSPQSRTYAPPSSDFEAQQNRRSIWESLFGR